MLVAHIRALGDAPAEIENATGFCDLQHPAHGWRDLRSIEMHDHGLAEQVVVGCGCDRLQGRQFGPRKCQLRIAAARLREQAVGCIEALGRIAVGSEPGHLAAAAAADIGGPAALDEKARDDVMQIGRRRLLVPVLRKRRCVVVVSRERSPIHGQPSILEKSATARVAARIWLSSFRRFSRTLGSSSLTFTLSKKASTAGRSFAIADIAPAKSSFATAALASAFT